MYLPKPSDTGSFELTPAGTFTALCYRFIDRGTHKNEFMGETKVRREIMLSWELCGEFMTDGRPFSASKTYTWSMHEKATLRKDLEAWRGKSFTDEDFDGPNAFNTKKLIGAPCTLTITHETKGDKTWSKVTSIGRVMKGVGVPAMLNPPVYLALIKGEFDPTAFAGLSDKMRGIIAESPEYRELVEGAYQYGDPGNPGHPDDEIPF